jgi:hypothetical protein
LQYWGLNSESTAWATPPAIFLWRVFQDRVSWTIYPGWLQTEILLIFASWVARITGVSTWLFFSFCFYYSIDWYRTSSLQPLQVGAQCHIIYYF